MRVRISKQWAAVAVAIFGVVFLLYTQSLWNDFVLWDDDYLIVNNPLIRSLSLHSIWTAFTSYDPELYIPITFLSYQINYLIAGLHPFIYHLTNLLLHATNALLVSAVAYHLSKKNFWISVAAGLFFAVHPLHTEAVIWASARKDVLASTFFLSSLLLYLQYRDTGLRSSYTWSVAMFLFALLSKVSVIALPLILLMIDWRDGRQWTRKVLIEKVPYFKLSAFAGVIALYGKTQQIAHSTITETVLLVIKSTAFYLEKIVLPLHLSPMYPFIGDIHLTSPEFFIPTIVIIALAGGALWSLRWTREAMFALLFFLLAIAPSMFNFRKGEEGDIYIASDRYAYLASFAVLFLVCVVLFRLREKLSPMIINIVVAVMVITLGPLAYMQTGIWNDSETLFTSVIASYPQAQAAHHNLGVLYQKEGRLQDALNQYQAALAIAPKASTESNVGDIFRENGQFSDAAAHYQNALTLNPRSVDAELGMGFLRLEQNDIDSAIAAFQSAVEYGPLDARTRLNLGAA